LYRRIKIEVFFRKNIGRDTNGYGPNGKIYIAHVDIPMNVLKAFEDLKVEYGDLVRVANPLYASKLGYLVKRSRVVPRRSFKEICLIIDYTFFRILLGV
jgi:hypothetical protein